MIYQGIVHALKEQVSLSRDAGRPLSELNDAFARAREPTAALLQGHDQTAHRMLRPLLMTPINVGA